MSDIFISYAEEDRSRARELADAFEQGCLTVWWDRDIPPGRPFAEVIQERLDNAKCVVVLWSRNSSLSNWVKDEASEGLERKILVPVLIESDAIPLGFRQVHAADLTAWSGRADDKEFRSLLQSVMALVGAEGAGAEPPKPLAEISLWRRSLNVVALALLALFSLGALSGTCANRDWVMITIIAGLLASTFLLFRAQGIVRFLWILAPAVTFVVGMPYGHSYGTITRSPLFGLEMGDYCQVQPDSYYLLGGLFLIALIVDLFFFFWSRRRRRWIPLTSAAVFLSVGAILATSYLLRYSDQYDHAEMLARKYGYFSTGTERWSRPTASGFRNDFQAKGDIVRDATTGLVWHRSGSPESIVLSEIPSYIEGLNTQRHGGFTDWRLPSLAEAWTLLEHGQRQGLHVDPIFGVEQEWIWTSTVTDDGYGWFVHFNWGRPYFQNAWGSHAYVRAVRGQPWE